MMGGEDPTQGSISPLGSKMGGVDTTDASDDDLPEKGKQKEGSSSSDDDKQLEDSPESNTETQGADEGKSIGTTKYVAERTVKALDGTVKRLVEEVKNLSLSMDNVESDEE
jgi:hypothetical protein